jgi:hypothetical protein
METTEKFPIAVFQISSGGLLEHLLKSLFLMHKNKDKR